MNQLYLNYSAALMDEHVRAFLRVVREGESKQTDDAFTMLFGGGHFDSFADHPRIKFWEKHDEFIHNGKPDYTTAAGVGQITETTWNKVARKVGLTDFTPRSQLIAMIALIDGRGALEDVERGDLETAIEKCNKEWASLPGSPWGQPRLTLEHCRKVWDRWLEADAPALPANLDSLDQPAAPIEERGIPQHPQAQEEPMAPLIAALANVLIGAFAPLAQEKISKELARHSSPEVAEQVSTALVDAAKAATKKEDPVEAVAAAKNDPAVMAQVQAAGLAKLEELMPVFEKLRQTDDDLARQRIEGRAAAAAVAKTDTFDVAPVLVQNVTGMSWAILGGLIVGIVAAVIVKAFWHEAPDYLNMLIALAGPLFGQVMKERGAIVAYRFDGTPSSNAANAINAELAKRSKG